jgi:hypothetical protein
MRVPSSTNIPNSSIVHIHQEKKIAPEIAAKIVSVINGHLANNLPYCVHLVYHVHVTQ